MKPTYADTANNRRRRRSKRRHTRLSARRSSTPRARNDDRLAVEDSLKADAGIHHEDPLGPGQAVVDRDVFHPFGARLLGQLLQRDHRPGVLWMTLDQESPAREPSVVQHRPERVHDRYVGVIAHDLVVRDLTHGRSNPGSIGRLASGGCGNFDSFPGDSLLQLSVESLREFVFYWAHGLQNIAGPGPRQSTVKTPGNTVCL